MDLEQRSEIVSHYRRASEATRLSAGVGVLEWVRMLELIERFAPRKPARLLDAGAGPGAYALWLARAGFEVHVLDLVPEHVDQARAASGAQPEHPIAGFEVGDACELAHADASFDAVLLFGPLYHLPERADRIRAWSEARRVCRRGGRVLAACISRCASIFDGLRLDVLRDPNFRAIVERDLAEGRHENPTERLELFTTAYFHQPSEIPAELEEAGLAWKGTFGVEGPGWMLADFEERWRIPRRRADLLFAARALEREASVLGASAHLFVVAEPR